MKTWTSPPIHYADTYNSQLFTNELEDLATRKFYQRFILKDDGSIGKTHFGIYLLEKFKNVLGLENRAYSFNNDLIKIRFIQIVDYADKKNWIQKNNLKNMQSLATQMGIIKEQDTPDNNTLKKRLTYEKKLKSEDYQETISKYESQLTEKINIFWDSLNKTAFPKEQPLEHGIDETQDLQQQDLQQTVDSYELAATQGDSYAQTLLGELYETGRGVAQDLKKAIELYRLAADQGNRFAQTNLAELYETGKGVAQDFKKAAELYQLAAKQDDSHAQNNLGELYQHGEGVTKDIKKAIDLYQLAADQGNSSAQNNLGELYERGEGVEKNFLEAITLYQEAAQQGNTEARANLQRLHQKIMTES